MKKIFFLFIFLISSVFLYAILVEPYRLEITHYKLPNKDLAGIKLVFVSDLHFGNYVFENYRSYKIIEAINSQQADVVLLGGDYVNGHTQKSAMPLSKTASVLQTINTPAYAVLGNHDSYYGKNDILHLFQKINIPVLDNKSTHIQLKGKTLSIAGIADYYTDTPNIDLALKEAQKPTIFLTHSPDALSLQKINAALILAGHTHGGQIVLPYIGAPIVPLENDKRYMQGLFYENNTPIIISRGLGTSMLPLRFNSVPEITVIEFE